MTLALLLAGALAASAEEGPVSRPIDPDRFVASGPHVRSFAKEVEVAASPATVWSAWATPRGWNRVYPPPALAHIDLVVGGRYEWLFDGKIGSNGCQVLGYVPDRMIQFSWNAPPSQAENREKRTWVVVECLPQGEGATRLRLKHLGFGTGTAWDETYAYFDAAWDSVLARFQEVLATAG
jgi:uncharacterized protein YndB with AHSA1/START domain